MARDLTPIFDAVLNPPTVLASYFFYVKNTNGEFHLILVFDLKPDVELQVTLREP